MKNIEMQSEKLSYDSHFFESVDFLFYSFLHASLGAGRHASLNIGISSLSLQAIQTYHIYQELSDPKQKLLLFLFDGFVGLGLKLFQKILSFFEELI